jgi:hypothetical protein
MGVTIIRDVEKESCCVDVLEEKLLMFIMIMIVIF